MSITNLSTSSSVTSKHLPQPSRGWTGAGLIKSAFLGFLLLFGNANAVTDLCQRSDLGHFCEGNLGISRANMPQLDGQLKYKYILDKAEGGFDVQNMFLEPSRLTPIQAEINYELVQNLAKLKQEGKFDPCADEILVTDNGTHHFIMDGHHRAAACYLSHGEQNAFVIRDNEQNVLSEMQLRSGTRKELDDSEPPGLLRPEMSSNKYWVYSYPGSKSGMFSTFLSLLGMIDKFDRELQYYSGFTIDFGDQGMYYDPAKGTNWWQYYFEPLQIGMKPQQAEEISKLERWHYANCAESNFRGTQKQIPRAVANAHFKKYFKLRPEIEAEIHDFTSKHFEGKNIVSVHYRGTDKVDSARAESNRVSYETMHENIVEQVQKQNLEEYKIFVATDEEAFVAFMNEKFPGKVITTNIVRSSDGQPLHVEKKEPYKHGKGALLDCMLLARGNVLIRTSSNLSLFSTFINPDMPVYEVSKRIPTEGSAKMFKALEEEPLDC